MKLFFSKKKLFSVGKKISQNESDKLKFLSQSFQGIEEVKVYGLKNFILENFKKTTDLLFRNNAISYFLKKLPRLFIELIFLIFCLAFLFILKSIDYDFIEILPLITFYLAASFKALPSVTRILNSFTTFRFCNSAIDNIYSDLENDKEKSTFSKKLEYKNKIQLENLSFYYDIKKRF